MTSAPIELTIAPIVVAPTGPGESGGTSAAGAAALTFAALVDQALSARGSVAVVPAGAKDAQDAEHDDDAATRPRERHKYKESTKETTQATAEGTTEDKAEVATGATVVEGALAILLAAMLASARPVAATAAQPTTAATSDTDEAAAVPGSGTPPAVPGDTGPADTRPATTEKVLDLTAFQPVAPQAAPAAPSQTGRAAETSSTTPEQTVAPATVEPDSVTVVASGPMTVTGPVPVGGSSAPHSVVSQVIPEITRLVSDGEGVHRVTLQLNPRALGEVRVVLTIRQGEVHVRLAAGEEARNALASSSSELSRALHQIGLDEHRITLIDLQGAAATRSGSTSDHPTDPRQHAHQPGGFESQTNDQNSHHSRMGDERTATDGSNTSTPPARDLATGRTQTVSLTRAAGAVDLRM